MAYTCNTCGEEFENRSLLGKHYHKEHRPPKMPVADITDLGEVPVEEIEIAPDEKKIIIPLAMVEELQWIAVGMPARLQVFGYRTEAGFEFEGDGVRYKP